MTFQTVKLTSEDQQRLKQYMHRSKINIRRPCIKFAESINYFSLSPTLVEIYLACIEFQVEFSDFSERRQIYL